MTQEKVYLRQNVPAQPLFNQWYAWPCLIAPATAAMYIANSHLKIMQSFVAAPQVHVATLKNPAMRGGPFINYEAARAPQIRALVERTREEQRPLLELADAIQRLSATLAEEGDGSSLEPLYEKVPEALQGYVELVYDLNNSASFRLIEGLLYRSRYYDPAAQSLALSLVERDERPFALSTPLLGGDGHLELKIPFASPALDELFRMKFEPRPYGFIKEALGVADRDDEQFATFFTAEPARPARRYAGEGVRVRYFGHACVLVETKETAVLTDPLVSYRSPEGPQRYTYADLPEVIDYVLITHNHQDHCMFETLLQIRHRVGTVLVPKSNGGGLADPSLKLVLRNIGFERVVELDEMESLPVAGGAVTGLPFLGEHADLNIRTKMAYHVELEGKSVVFAADSNNLAPRLYENIHALIGDVDVLFIGMECDGGPLSWLYGPLMCRPLARKFDQSRRLNGSDYVRGLDLVNRLNPKQVYVYAMGQEPWLTFLTSIQYTEESRPIVDSNRLVENCAGRGITAERLFGHKEIQL
jgi:L-ascorbate metabolism protein UlaG (beta-lactamase superfamily)